MRTNREILDNLVEDINELHNQKWQAPLAHTTIKQAALMFEFDTRDYCTHDKCLALQAADSAMTMGNMIDRQYPLHVTLVAIVRNALLEIAGIQNDVVSGAEEFLRNLPRDSN